MAELPEVVMWHERGPDEGTAFKRSTCATCGWKGKWRDPRGGWAERDWWQHREETHDAAMDDVWEKRARPAEREPTVKRTRPFPERKPGQRLA